MRKCLLLMLLILISITSVALAAEQKIEADGTYQMGENDTITNAKEMAKNNALRNAAEKAGVYVRAYSKTKNFELTDDEILVVAANVMKVKECNYKQEYDNDTLVFYAHVIVTVDDSKFDSIIEHEKKRLDLEEKLKEEQERNKEIKNLQIQHGAKDIETETAIFKNTRLFLDGEYTKAMFNLSNIIKSRDKIVPARVYYLRSAAYFQLEKYNEALADIKKAINIDGDNPIYYVQEAFIHLAVSQLYKKWNQYGQMKNEFLLSEAKCETALRFKGAKWPAYYGRAMARHLNDNLRKSVNDSKNAIRHGGRGISCVENFNSYISAQYEGRHKRYIGKSDIMLMLNEGVIELVKVKEKK